MKAKFRYFLEIIKVGIIIESLLITINKKNTIYLDIVINKTYLQANCYETSCIFAKIVKVTFLFEKLL